MRLFLTNLGLLVLLGTAVCGWILRYTEFFPVIGGLLGLGGVFAWIAFLTNIVSEDRRAALQAAVDKVLFQSRRATAVLSILFGCFLVGPVGMYGAVEVGNGSLDETFRVTVGRADRPADSEFILRPSESRIVTVFTGWFGSAQVRVAAEDVPAIARRLGPLDVEAVELPGDAWLTPSLAMRPTFASFDDVRRLRPRLELCLPGGDASPATWRTDTYNGRSILVGATAPVPVPPWTRAAWQSAGFGNGGAGEAIGYWRLPGHAWSQIPPRMGSLCARYLDRNGNEICRSAVALPIGGRNPADVALPALPPVGDNCPTSEVPACDVDCFTP